LIKNQLYAIGLTDSAVLEPTFIEILPLLLGSSFGSFKMADYPVTLFKFIANSDYFYGLKLVLILL